MGLFRHCDRVYALLLPHVSCYLQDRCRTRYRQLCHSRQRDGFLLSCNDRRRHRFGFAEKLLKNKTMFVMLAVTGVTMLGLYFSHSFASVAAWLVVSGVFPPVSIPAASAR